MVNGTDLFGLNEKELFDLLKIEKEKTKLLAEQATKEIHKWSNQFKTLNFKPPKTKIDKSGFDIRSKIMAAIEAERRKQRQINLTISKIKTGSFNLNQILGFDFIKDTSNIGATSGDDAHDKYARVMENVSNAADIRETWDSADVLKIDDIAIQENISYDEARAIVEGSSGEVETEDV